MSQEINLTQSFFRHASFDNEIKSEVLLDEDESRDDYYSKYPIAISLSNDALRFIHQAGNPGYTAEEWFEHEDDQKTILHDNFRKAIAASVIFTTEKINDAINSQSIKIKQTFPATLLLIEADKNELFSTVNPELIELGITQQLIHSIPAGHDYLVMTGVCSCGEPMCFSRYAWIEKNKTGNGFRILMMLEEFSPHIFVYTNWENLKSERMEIPHYKKVNSHTLFKS